MEREDRRRYDWIARNPRGHDETVREWKERYYTKSRAEAVRSAATYERRLWLSMLGRGILAAYLLGLLLSLGELNPRDWQPFAGICAFSFLIGWVVMMNMERE